MQSPFDSICLGRCPHRTRSGCRLNEHPKFTKLPFYDALMWKTLVNEDDLERFKATFLDILDEWEQFEQKLPAECQHALAEISSGHMVPPDEATMAKLRQRLNQMRSDKGLPPV